MKTLATFLTFVFLATGCASTYQLDETQSGALGGGALGAGLGAIIGNQTGNAGAGTAIGAATGALAGAFVGEGIKRSGQRQAYQNQYPASTYSAPQTIQQGHTKYNPITGQTFPEQYKYDPADGTELKYLQ